MSGSKAGEHDYLRSLLKHFFQYEEWQTWFVDSLEGDFKSMSKTLQTLIPSFPNKIESMRKSIRLNQNFLNACAQTAAPILRQDRVDPMKVPMSELDESHMSRLTSILRQMCREWSDEGKEERDQCFKPLIDVLEARFPDKAARHKIRVLVPGCGLARLPWDIASKGFSCEGNEFTWFMLLPARVVLSCSHRQQYAICPYATETKNVKSAEQQMRRVAVPDVNPSSMGRKPDGSPFLTLSSGDWMDIYKGDGSWDCIVTCFFIDTAKNVLTYLEKISRLLRPGGIWVNLGPLLYHYGTDEMRKSKIESNIKHLDQPASSSGGGGGGGAAEEPIGGGEQSVELSYEELKEALPHFGLKMEEEKTGLYCQYCQDPHSFKHQSYRCVHFVCTKV